MSVRNCKSRSRKRRRRMNNGSNCCPLIQCRGSILCKMLPQKFSGNVTGKKAEGKRPTLIQRHKRRTAAAAARCVADSGRADCRLSPHTRACNLAAKQPHAARVCRLMVSTLVIRVITWITTHLPTRRDGRLSWPSWLTHMGHFTHKLVTCQP